VESELKWLNRKRKRHPSLWPLTRFPPPSLGSVFSLTIRRTISRILQHSSSRSPATRSLYRSKSCRRGGELSPCALRAISRLRDIDGSSANRTPRVLESATVISITMLAVMLNDDALRVVMPARGPLVYPLHRVSGVSGGGRPRRLKRDD